MNRFIFTGMLAAAVLFTLRCTTKTAEEANEGGKRKAIAPPFSGVDVPFQAFEVNALEETTLSFRNTDIHIPAACFTDMQGNPVQGKVDLQYREFHNAAEILASGITMQYDSAGHTSHFQTAGMFEINAKANGQQLKIADGKAITVNMASAVEGNDYNSYHLDTAACNWSFKSTTASTPIAASQEEFGAPLAEPVKPQEYNPSAYTFDLDVNVKKFPELKDLSGLMWQYAGNSKETDPERNPGMTSREWSDVKLEAIAGQKGVYNLVLSDGAVTFTTVARPVLRGKAFEKAMKRFESNMAAYTAAIDQRQAQRRAERTYDAQMKVSRAFAVSSFGVYNYDRNYHNSEAIRFAADFDFGKAAVKDEEVMVFLITGDGRALINFPYTNWKLFSFVPADDNKMVAVLPGNKVAVFTQKQFDKVADEFEAGSANNSYVFNMKVLDAPIASTDQLIKLVESL